MFAVGIFLAIASWNATPQPRAIEGQLSDYQGPADLYVVCVGINEYGPGFGGAQMRFAKADAAALADTLSKRSRFLCGKPDVNLLIDSRATKENIVEAFRSVARNSKTRDVFIYLHSGRGLGASPEHRDRGGFLVPYGARADIPPHQPAAGMISARELESLSRAIPSERQIYVLNTSHSESFADVFERSVQARQIDVGFFSDRKVAVLGAAARGGVWEEPRFGHSLFCQAVLEALEGRVVGRPSVRVSPVSVRHVDSYVRRRYPELIKRNAPPSFASSYVSRIPSDFRINLTTNTLGTMPGLRPPLIKPPVDPGPDSATKIELIQPLPSIDEGIANPRGVMLIRVKASDDVRRLTIEGVEASFEDGEWRAPVIIPKDRTNLRISAETFAGKTVSRSVTFEIKKAPAPAPLMLGKSYALIVGIDRYSGSGWSQLSNAIRDAEAVGKVLQDQYGFEVTYLRNATKSSLREAIRSFKAKRFGPYDQFLLYYSGHGYYDEQDPNGVVVMSDSKGIADDPTFDTFVDHAFMRDALNDLGCQQVLAVLDSCFSGIFDRRLAKSDSKGEPLSDPTFCGLLEQLQASLLPSPQGTTAPVVRRGRRSEELANICLAFRTRCFLVSGGKHLVSDGPPGGHSPFASRLIEVLSKGGEDGVLTFSGLTSLMERMEPIPRFGSFGDDAGWARFVFVAKS